MHSRAAQHAYTSPHLDVMPSVATKKIQQKKKIMNYFLENKYFQVC